MNSILTKFAVFISLVCCCIAEPIKILNGNEREIFNKYDAVYILELDKFKKDVHVESIKALPGGADVGLIKNAIEELQLLSKYDKNVIGSLILVNHSGSQIGIQSDYFDNDMITRRNMLDIKIIREENKK